jgi:sulfatase-modifying factor enzyme 1/putative metal-binding protein
VARSLAYAALALASLGVGGCNIDPYHLSFPLDGGTTTVDARQPADASQRPDARIIPDANTRDVPANCVPSVEVCDNEDNDCDGVADNGFDKNNDPRNCGSCGHACVGTPTQFGTCHNGQCEFTCLSGYHDKDGVPCSYFCIPTNNGVEQCDGQDNNCDGQIDEGFNLDSDPNNCGTCNHTCVALHATAICVAGKCDYDRTKGCDPPFVDITDAILGCEYQCLAPVKLDHEECNNIDDDCDGCVDGTMVNGVCQPLVLGGSCPPPGLTLPVKAPCQAGTLSCVAGSEVCSGYVGPQPEICDNKDNNCDGQVDEGYDKTNDPRHCGPNCTVCSLPFAVASCIPGTSGKGECAIAACLPGHVDFDGNPANGCELECTPTGVEVCDGIDNNCDGCIDGDIVNGVCVPLAPPAGLCATAGECSTATTVCAKGAAGCDETTHWRCSYPSTVEQDACGNLVAQEVLCDGLDGDCDGTPDDGFPIGQTCHDTGVGVCQGTGSYVCAANKMGVECGNLVKGTATTETCNGKDDDCDGTIDNPPFATNEMVTINDAVVGHFSIDKWEESRPDATDTDEGTITTHACSNPTKRPWSNLDHVQAAAACAAAGKRLCDEDEWQRACGGAAGQTYPYLGGYQGTACNGADAPGDDVKATGTMPNCDSPDGPLDMSGNLEEWTRSAVGGGNFRIRGGSYETLAGGLTCQFDFVDADASFQYFDLGFRCCKDAP